MLTCVDNKGGLILSNPLLNGAFRGDLGCRVDRLAGRVGLLASLDGLFVECTCGDRELLVRLGLGHSKG